MGVFVGQLIMVVTQTLIELFDELAVFDLVARVQVHLLVIKVHRSLEVHQEPVFAHACSAHARAQRNPLAPHAFIKNHNYYL